MTFLCFRHRSINILITLLVAFVLVLHLQPARACTCLSTTFKDLVCASEATFLATVVATYDNCAGRRCDIARVRDRLEGTVVYLVVVKKHFRGLVIEDNVAALKTNLHPSLCATSLSLHNTYLFSLSATVNATVLPNALYLTSCDLVADWTQLPPRQKQFVKRSNLACPPA